MAYLTTEPRTERMILGSRAFLSPMANVRRAFELYNDDTAEVLSFLAERPVHTVAMASFIRDNGLVSDLNRGTFYGYRNAAGKLEGVALIGHSTLIEVRNNDAMYAFAIEARRSVTPIHMIMSDGRAAEKFWDYLRGHTTRPRMTCVEELFELNFPFLVQNCRYEVRHATLAELEQVAEAQAEVAFIESGVDPMEKDRDGFLKRVARRIEQSRVYVVMKDGKLLFKADVVALTDSVAYLEGVYVDADSRGQGIGGNCLAEVGMRLLDQVQHVCLLSNVNMPGARKSFLKAGFKNTDRCTTLFV